MRNINNGLRQCQVHLTMSGAGVAPCNSKRREREILSVISFFVFFFLRARKIFERVSSFSQYVKILYTTRTRAYGLIYRSHILLGPQSIYCSWYISLYTLVLKVFNIHIHIYIYIYIYATQDFRTEFY